MPLLATNSELLLGFRAGADRALECVYRHYYPLVRGAVSAAAAKYRPGHRLNLEDMVQEVFLKAFSNSARADYDGIRPYGPYLSAIARNIVAGEARQGCREVVADPERIICLISDRDEPMDVQPNARTCAQLASVVKELPPGLRAVYDVRYEAGMSQRDASVALGVSRQNLRTLERKLLQSMRRRLQDTTASDLLVA